MKQQLTEQERFDLMIYRLQRAHETMKEALVMSRESFYNAAVNRLYYACYYAAIALLIKNEIQPQTHNGVKTMLGLHFLSKGKLSREHGNTFNTLFEKRESGDYDDFIYNDKETIDELYPQAEAFIQAIEELINPKE